MLNPKQFAVIWDVDGTLVDTAELHFQAWLALARELDTPFTRANFDAAFGLRNPDIIPTVLWQATHG
jgi:beta-phosphoglucomutase-like phosphatase (HAD superfamily)